MKSEGLTASLLTDVHKVFVSLANSEGERDREKGERKRERESTRERTRNDRMKSFIVRIENQLSTKSFVVNMDGFVETWADHRNDPS